MGTKTLLTLEDFARLPDDGLRHELNEGELVTMPPPVFQHSEIVRTIQEALSKYVNDRGLGHVYVEAGYLLSPHTVRQPDLSFVSTERLRNVKPESYIEGAPDLALEVVSPSNTAVDLHLRVTQYLAAGAQAVCVVYPQTRQIQVYRPDGSSRVLNENQTLELPDLFPGWSVRVAELLA